MDDFVDAVINTEVKEIKSTMRKLSCPGCGLMIRGDESKCPRCDLPLEEAEVDCPICGEKTPIKATSCPNCQAVFEQPEEASAESILKKPSAPKKQRPEVPPAKAEVKPSPAKKETPAKKKPVTKKGKGKSSKKP